MKKIVLFLLMLFSLCTIKAQNDSIRLKKFVVGEKFQNFAYKDVSGKTYSLKDFKGKYVYIDFWATWCAPCRMIAPIIAELAEEYDGKIAVGKCDVEEADEIASEFGIRNIPTILFLKNGEVVDKFVGAASKAKIEEKFKALL